MMNTTPRPNPQGSRKSRRSGAGSCRSGGLRARVLSACCALALLAGAPAAVHAQSASDETTDARLQGYAGRPALEKSGVGPTWLLFIALSIIGCSVLFKNAKRSHLD